MNTKIRHKILEYGPNFVLEAIEEKVAKETGQKDSYCLSVREYYNIENDNDLENICEFLHILSMDEGTEFGDSLDSMSHAFFILDPRCILDEKTVDKIQKKILKIFKAFEKLIVVKDGQLVWKDTKQKIDCQRAHDEYYKIL